MDKNFRLKALSLIVLLGAAIYVLIPSFRLYSLPESEWFGTDPAVQELRGKALKLGLDLQGGMHLVLKIDKSTLSEDEVPDAMDRAIQILANRIDQFGVAEPILQRQGDDRILIQLPGLLDRQRAVDLIGQMAELEFRLVKQPAESRQVIERLDRYLARHQAGTPDTLSPGADSLEVLDNPLIDLLYGYPDVTGYGGVAILRADVSRVESMLESVDLDEVLPRDAGIALSMNDEVFEGGMGGKVLYVLNRTPELTGRAIANAVMRFNLDPQRPNLPGVSLTMNASGARDFRRVTGANVGRQLAIVLDNRVASAPVIRDRIPGGQAQITGTFSPEEAGDLAIILRAGALPARMHIAEERTVGPTLGRDSIRTGVSAALVGAVVVVLFMVFYYRLSGLVAVCALVLNIVFLMAGLAALRGTLTLPGIAGIVLTIGMAVDANVLVFERIREELRNGKRVRAAIDAGYSRAWRTILDANLTTLISAAVLFQFGTGPIKGFAVTLAIGIIANLYTAVLVTRMIFGLFTAGRSPRNLSI